MRKFIYQSLMLVAVALMAFSCSTDEIDFYNVEENAIRFPGMTGDTYYSGYSSADGYFFGSYSFIENPTAEWEEYLLPVNIIGMVSDSERKIAVTVVEEGTTAPDGTYEILGGSIAAGEREGFVRIKLANAEELKSTSYQVKVKLQETADFKLGPKQFLTAVLTWNSILPAPTNNNLKRSYNMLVYSSLAFTSTSLNNYSTSAHLAIVDALGWDDWGDAEVHGSQANTASYDNCYNYLPRYTWIYTGDLYKAYAKKLDEYLKAYEAEHGEPLLHDGGGLVGQPVQARSY